MHDVHSLPVNVLLRYNEPAAAKFQLRVRVIGHAATSSLMLLSDLGLCAPWPKDAVMLTAYEAPTHSRQRADTSWGAMHCRKISRD